MADILIVDDDPQLRQSFVKILSEEGHAVLSANSGEAGIRVIKEKVPDLIVMDVKMPGMNGLETFQIMHQIEPKIPVIIMTAYGTTETAIEAIKLGAYEYILKPFDIPDVLELIEKALLAGRYMRAQVTMNAKPKESVADAIVGHSVPMQEVYKAIGRAAPTDATILIRGETGTGKELVARALYQHSLRSAKPFLIINCVAIPENLLESELFGYERGSFTGASSRRIGKIEQANRGTVFLDEIGDMSYSIQAKILRLLQERSIERLGGKQPIPVDVRVIAATNRDLEAAVAAGRFREDLYYRLKVVTLSLPTLRERPGDIPGLTEYFLQRFSQEMGIDNPGVSKSALTILKSHHWPGNVRELANTIQKALIFSKGGPLDKQDIIRLTDDVPHNRQTVDADQAMPFEGMLNQWIHQKMLTSKEDNLFESLMDFFAGSVTREALSITGGNRSQASKLLGLSRPTLLAKIDKYGLKIHTDVTR